MLRRWRRFHLSIFFTFAVIGAMCKQRRANSTCIPCFKLTLDAAKRHNLRVAFRIQMSNTEGQPGRLALPDFLQKQVPLVKIGKTYGAKEDFVEPRYDHPRFQSAFKELNELLVR